MNSTIFAKKKFYDLLGNRLSLEGEATRDVMLGFVAQEYCEAFKDTGGNVDDLASLEAKVRMIAKNDRRILNSLPNDHDHRNIRRHFKSAINMLDNAIQSFNEIAQTVGEVDIGDEPAYESVYLPSQPFTLGFGKR